MISPLPVSPLISSKKVSIIGDVGPVLIKFYRLRRRKECFTQFLPLHLLLKKTLRGSNVAADFAFGGKCSLGLP